MPVIITLLIAVVALEIVIGRAVFYGELPTDPAMPFGFWLFGLACGLLVHRITRQAGLRSSEPGSPHFRQE